MTSNDVSVVMGGRIELGEGHPAVGGGWLDATAAPLPRSFNDGAAALDRTRVTGLVVVAAGQESTIVQETHRFMAHRLAARTRSYPVDHAPAMAAPSLVLDIVREAVERAAAGCCVRSFRRRTKPLSQSRQSPSPSQPINVLQGEQRCPRMM
jgi:hypothetical protein